jgi:hypothetical protein
MPDKVAVFLSQRFTQMMAGDVPLWQRFLTEHGEYFDRFEYNAHVGEGVPLDPSWPPNIIKAAQALTTKRIDAVGYRGFETWLFEVKPDAGLSALGQLLAYRVLWERDVTRPGVNYLAIITDRMNPDEKLLFDTYGIKIYVVTPQ